MEESTPVCALCRKPMCEHDDCTSPQVRLADGRCFNCGNIDCPNYKNPPCEDGSYALPLVI